MRDFLWGGLSSQGIRIAGGEEAREHWRMDFWYYIPPIFTCLSSLKVTRRSQRRRIYILNIVSLSVCRLRLPSSLVMLVLHPSCRPRPTKYTAPPLFATIYAGIPFFSGTPTPKAKKGLSVSPLLSTRQQPAANCGFPPALCLRFSTSLARCPPPFGRLLFQCTSLLGEVSPATSRRGKGKNELQRDPFRRPP